MACRRAVVGPALRARGGSRRCAATLDSERPRRESRENLRGRKVQIRFDRLKFDRAIVYFKGERKGEARPVDFVANDRKPIRKNKATPHESYDVSEVEL